MTTFTKYHFMFVLFFLNATSLKAQVLQLPEPITNHATALLKNNRQQYIYTFYGLDSSKKWQGVHKKVFRLNMQTGKSQLIGLVPDSIGRLASSAAVIGNKAYIAGGYGVYANGKEISSKQLFIFDAKTETFKKGADLPVAIDDQIQSVWRDSLLYVISGWNDSNNAHAVQLYNPVSNQWQMATPLPNEITAAVFGGCGTIYGDTIYVLGGAAFAKFYPPSRQFYKGIINKSNPAVIKWINAGEHPGAFRYRAAAFEKNGKIYFWGGSNDTYNYDGISYKEKLTVQPNATCLIYNISTGTFTVKAIKESIMDLRNAVKTTKQVWYVAGGIGNDLQVKKTVSKIRLQ
jgi:N-acetylneuraminic acid mutarotase